ncbi:unnamed protein product [Lactuca saligna]|uniref:Protein kinase domain-containing protein n=1 Tax=Lactuca saligna TaxID=75948 RepID=A0AA35ZQ10_LACSI|nr:unnamed protein product [Lactuca saligna]
MASDNKERKHRRSSDDESEEPSKRRKHRHHRRRHHRHHSRKHDKHEDRREEGEEETTDMPPPPLPLLPSANSQPDYDMEEGEILEEDGADVGVKKTADSDAESGEIKMETHGALVVPNHSHVKEESLSKEDNSNGHIRSVSPGGNDNIKTLYDEDHETRNNDYKHHRPEETDYRDRTRKYDGQKGESHKGAPSDVDTEKTKREEADEEMYQERSSLQIEEDEEEDLNRIKEESRRRRQAILEKYKTKSLKQQQQQPVPQLEDTSKANSGTLEGQGELSDSNTGDTPFSVGRSPPQNGVERTSGTGGLGEGTPKSERSNGDDIFGESPPHARERKEERSNDMFTDDIFGESPTGVRKPGKGDGLAIQRSGLQDNWDDAEGYYSYRFGEVLDSRYEVLAAHGKGVFSTVVRAKDLKAGSTDPEEVAIKIIRNNDKMYKAGLEELVILKKLVGADMEDRRHCLFIALKHLRNCGVLHTDIKPDNMLVNDAKNVLKLCDFGNAMFAGKNEITPYLVSRFYRAPEIILGLTYDHPVDMWSVGCCLFELYTGKVLFPGATNNDMLRLHMELKGSFPKKMLRKGAFTEQHFDSDLNFVAIEEDPVTKKTVKRLVNMKAKDISSIVVSSPGEDPKMLANFKDLLEKIFILDPDKRLTVHQALNLSNHWTFICVFLYLCADMAEVHADMDDLTSPVGSGMCTVLLKSSSAVIV